jgi:hypothetical protein
LCLEWILVFQKILCQDGVTVPLGERISKQQLTLAKLWEVCHIVEDLRLCKGLFDNLCGIVFTGFAKIVFSGIMGISAGRSFHGESFCKDTVVSQFFKNEENLSATNSVFIRARKWT